MLEEDKGNARARSETPIGVPDRIDFDEFRQRIVMGVFHVGSCEI